MSKLAALSLATALTVLGAVLWFNAAPLAALVVFAAAAVFDYLFVRALVAERRRVKG